MVKTSLNRVDLVTCNPELLQTNKCLQVLYSLNLIITDPKSLKVDQVLQSLNGSDAVVGQVDLLETDAFVEPIDFGYFVLVEPQGL